MTGTTRLRLGQLLVDARMITAESLAEVLAAQKADGRRLGVLLVERGLINETQLTQILSHQLSVPWVSLLHIEFSRQLLNLVPHDVAERFCLVPIYVRHVRGQGQTLYVAMDDPTNEEALRECQTFSGLPVRAMIAPPTDIRNAIRVYYGGAAPKPAPVRQPSPAEATPRPIGEAPRARRSSPPARRLTPVPSAAVAAAPRVPSEMADHAEAAQVVRERAAEVPAAAAVAEPPAATVRSSDSPPPSQRISPPPSSQRTAPPSEEQLAKAQKIRALIGSTPDDQPAAEIPTPAKGRAPRMVSLTLLDGTSITLPARRGRDAEPKPEPAATPAEEDSALTARDLIAALRAVSHGADATEILGSNVRWEAMFAALLSLLLKKHLIADWEFVDEFRKI